MSVLLRDLSPDASIVEFGCGYGTFTLAAARCTRGAVNALDIESPVALLREAYHVLKRGTRLSVMHWRRDIPTPRGPPLTIRPGRERCEEWALEAGFSSVPHVDLTHTCPYHFGLVAQR